MAATFFNLGVHEARLPSTVRAQYSAGWALGDHTWDHRDLPILGASAQATEMDRERAEQGSITGAYPCLFRPPYGSYNSTTLALAQNRGMRVWNWSVDTEDWKAAASGSSYWISRIESRAAAGGSQSHPVILLHNQPGGNPATVAALPTIISYYRSHGYRFVDLYGRGAPPSVSAVSPTSGRTAGGIRIKVTGHGFGGVRSVHFGGVAGTAVHLVSPSTLYVTSPAHAAGAVNIRVTTTFGTSPAVTPDVFRYVAPPTVTQVSPHAGPTGGGVRVRVSGTNFTSVTSVRFGTVAGTSVSVASPTTLYVTAPPQAAGLVGVRVTTRYGYSAWGIADHFTYVARPAVSSVAPQTGPVTGGTAIIVTGANFTADSSVTFGGVPGTSVSVTSPSSLSIVTPAHVAGTVPVLVTTTYGGTSATAVGDQYSYRAAP